MKQPYDPSRLATVGSDDIPQSALVDATIAKEPIRLFNKGVVIEVLGDPSSRDDAFFEKFAGVVDDDEKPGESFRNVNDLEKAPRNSLIVRPVDNGKGRDEDRHIICFPFFSSHVMMPIKPGETVWYSFIMPDAPSNRAYWLSRICDVDFVEDVNFTHHDRRHDDTIPDDDEAERIKPSLHNGPDATKTDPTAEPTEEEEEQHRTFEDPEAFKKIRDESVESKRFAVEPVPRITKRPGDLVLQGSNNTAIVMGTDYGFSLTKRPETDKEAKKSVVNSEEKPPPLQGSIDIVAGRGRIYSVDELQKLSDTKEPPKSTRPRVVQNAEGDFEVDKNTANDSKQDGNEEKSARVNLEADPNEGDPDFINDASRIYISMQTNPDDNFGTTIANIPEAYAADPTASSLQDIAAAATIALKSDEIRIVARKTKDKETELKDAEYEDAPDINGSIRIIKEGDPKKDAAAVYLLPDGTIQISGAKIMIGRSTIRDEGTAIHEAKDAEDADVAVAEPYMRYTEFNTWANGLINAINEAFANMQAAVNANGAAMDECAMQGMSGGAGGAIPAPNAPLGAALSAMMMPDGKDFEHDPDPIAKFKNTTKIKSTRIFGE